MGSGSYNPDDSSSDGDRIGGNLHDCDELEGEWEYEASVDAG